MPKLTRSEGKGRGGGKLRPLNMRTTAAIRDQLEAAAEASGRSLAQEVEYRLTRSFEAAPTLEERLEDRYGKHGAMILLLIGRELISRVSRAAPNCDIHTDWLNNPQAVDKMAEFLALVLKVLGPKDVASLEIGGEWGWLVAVADQRAGGAHHFNKLLRDLVGEEVSARAARRYQQMRGAQ